MAVRAKIRRVLKWVGLAVCVLTLLGCWAWTFSSRPWFPHPRYCTPHWGFAVGRTYLTLYYVTVGPWPPGTPVSPLTPREEHWVADWSASLSPGDLLPGSKDFGPYAEWLPTVCTQSMCILPVYAKRPRIYLPLITLPVLILIPAGAATVLLWYLDRQRSRSGHCEDCGYDLTGNVSGRCPECGAEIPRSGEAASDGTPG
jgi:hypothetical protein